MQPIHTWIECSHMDKKTSSSPEMEALRDRLIAMGRKETLQLARSLGLKERTIDKFRQRHFANLGGDKYAAISAALAESTKAHG